MSTPMDWQPTEAIQAKTGAMKRIYSPVDWKPERAIQAKMGWWKDNNKKKQTKANMQKCIDHRCDIQSVLNIKTSSNGSTIKRFHSLQVYEWDIAPCPQQWFRCVFQRRYLQREISQAYVRAWAITCPIFQCFVHLCEVVSARCQPSCTSKHSYMHNHASYMLMHLIKLSHCSYISAFSIPMLISVKINHVNFKPLLSC